LVRQVKYAIVEYIHPTSSNSTYLTIISFVAQSGCSSPPEQGGKHGPVDHNKLTIISVFPQISEMLVGPAKTVDCGGDGSEEP
jgi:hypothetical protein